MPYPVLRSCMRVNVLLPKGTPNLQCQESIRATECGVSLEYLHYHMLS